MPNQVTRAELLDDEEYADIVDDVTCELETKYGALASVSIPQPSRVGPGMDPPGVGLVFVQFASLGDAVRSPLVKRRRADPAEVWPCTCMRPPAHCFRLCGLVCIASGADLQQKTRMQSYVQPCRAACDR